MSPRDADPHLLFRIREYLHRLSGFPTCDYVASTLKRLAVCASLQRRFSEQILALKQLFEFSNNEITGATTYFVNSQSVEENVPFFGSRFSNCITVKETRKNHEFIAVGENNVMNFASGGTSENLIIQQKICVVY